MRKLIKRIYWLLSVQFGFDVRRMVLSCRGVPRFIADWLQFRKNYVGRLDLLPCLYDRFEEGGAAKDEYFFQDLHVAQKIFVANPDRHVDIGSRIDGFVAHVASFRAIEIFDIRPVTSQISGVVVRQADLTKSVDGFYQYCDSLSCLHALEHFGLGRYGDQVNPNGYMAGLANMASMLRPQGLFYLSVPVGVERVEFNAHRIFNPNALVQLARENGLVLRDFSWIGTDRILKHSSRPEEALLALGELDYALGIFSFAKQ